jgi:NAD(P)-dependent dehydrogenase (short-subunit alcohol dehydrogenase family)
LFQNKVALVTGATGALGKTVTRKLLENGARVAATYRTENGRNDLEQSVGALNSNLIEIKADVTDERSVQELIKTIIDKFGRIDFLLNIVGAYAGGTDIADTDLSQWDLMMNVNLKSAFLCAKTVLPHMMKQNYGRIVNVSSRTAVEKSRRAKSGAYAISKAGVIVLTETLADEMKNYDINVNCVMPSTIDTPSNRRNLPKADFSKWVDPNEIAEVMLFLLSDASKVTSGACIPVYGKA